MRSSTRRASAAGRPSSTCRRRAGCTSTRRSSRSSTGGARTRCACRGATPRPTPTATRTGTRHRRRPAPRAGRRTAEEVTMHDAAPWLTLALLGAFHGLNPAMGWLFAVALGLQERRRAAVLGAFGPIALGHAASIAVVVGAVGLARAWVSPGLLQVLGGSALLAFGLYKWLRPLSHPRWVGMR